MLPESRNALTCALEEDPGVVMDETGRTDPALALRVAGSGVVERAVIKALARLVVRWA